MPYEIWTAGFVDKDGPEQPINIRLYKICKSMKECGLNLFGLTPSQIRERMSWTFKPDFSAYHVINGWSYQIKKVA